MRLVPVGATFASVDDSDYEYLSGFKWRAENSNGVVYAKTNMPRDGSGKRGSPRMHQLLIPKRDGFSIDHVNGNGLDNQRANLRYATKGQQKMNSCKRKTLTSRLKGVQRVKAGWMARIRINGTLIMLGIYSTEEIAASAYDEACQIEFGEFARPNGAKV